jgi:hypothetical protein
VVLHWRSYLLSLRRRQPRGASHYGRRSRVRRFLPINCKKPRVQPLDPSHYGQSPKAVAISNECLLKKSTHSRRKFGSVGNGNPKYGREAVGFSSLKNQSLTRAWPLDWRGYFEQGIKWDAPLGLDFGRSLWRRHTMDVQVERLWEFMAKGLDFGLGLWKLHILPDQRLH